MGGVILHILNCHAYRLVIEAAAEAALNDGKSIAPSTAAGRSRWSHSSISVVALRQAIGELQCWPRPSEVCHELTKHALAVAPVREALLRCDWGQAATWSGLAEVLELPATVELMPARVELQDAFREFDEMRASTEEGVTAQLQSGGSVRHSDGTWSHENVQLDPLHAALAQLQVRRGHHCAPWTLVCLRALFPPLRLSASPSPPMLTPNPTPLMSSNFLGLYRGRCRHFHVSVLRALLCPSVPNLNSRSALWSRDGKGWASILHVEPLSAGLRATLCTETVVAAEAPTSCLPLS